MIGLPSEVGDAKSGWATTRSGLAVMVEVADDHGLPVAKVRGMDRLSRAVSA